MKWDRSALPLSGCGTQALPPGHRLAHLDIQRVIGEGGFSLVYQAFDPLRRQTVAVKEYIPSTLAIRNANGEVIPRNEFLSPTFGIGQAYFRQEAAILAGLSHPCVPRLLNFWQENNTAYISMPLYRGHNLKTLYAENPAIVTLPWLQTLLASLLDTVNTVHRQGCLHLDISWDNIQIQNGSAPVLLDFGSACFINNPGQKKTNIVLKPGFSPAELYCHSGGDSRGPWTDIYSLGALMYTLITGQLPPVSLTRCIEDRYQPLAKQRPAGYPLPFLQAIDQALAINAANRPQTIAAFSRLLGGSPLIWRTGAQLPVKERGLDKLRFALLEEQRYCALEGESFWDLHTRMPGSVCHARQPKNCITWLCPIGCTRL
ncbi:serine/threonine protein kinase [Serratia sp. L9]|uniref:serine/threonine protein kinase n=1 Tax=Serratia sp. L9 TaxID=3423946 RepID=UPI003D6705DE